jgi:PPOX class probable F420-dependent enzyme
MRTGLRPEDLGDFLRRPECATLAVHVPDDGMLLRPIWFEWRDGGFTFTTQEDDRKARALVADPTCSVLVTEDEWPYRSLEVRGRATVSRAHYREVARRIRLRYDPAGDPDAGTPADGLVVRLAPGILTVFDYLDEPPAGDQPRADASSDPLGPTPRDDQDPSVGPDPAGGANAAAPSV